MGNLQHINLASVESVSFDALPVGDYTAACTDAEVKKTKAEDGHYVQLTWQIVDGPGRGRKLWSRFNIANKSQQAVEIGLGQLKACCEAVGLQDVTDTSQLLQKVCILKIGIDPNDRERNTIKDYLRARGAQASQTPLQQPPAYTEQQISQQAPQQAASSAGYQQPPAHQHSEVPSFMRSK